MAIFEQYRSPTLNLWLALPRRLTLNMTLKFKLHTLENECAARYLDEESFETILVAIGLLL